MTNRAAVRWREAAEYWGKAATAESEGHKSLAQQYRDYARQNEAQAHAMETEDAILS